MQVTGTLAFSRAQDPDLRQTPPIINIILYSPNKPMKTVGPITPEGVLTVSNAASLCSANVGETIASIVTMIDTAIVSHESTLRYTLGSTSIRSRKVDRRRRESKK